MTTKLTNWAMDAQTAASILGVPVETFRTWRKRHGLLPQPDEVSGRRKPPMYFEFRHLLQAMVAQKLMSVGVQAEVACKASHYGVFQSFVNRQRVVVGFFDGQFRAGGYSDDDVCLTLSVEKSGREIANKIAGNIEMHEGSNVAEAALDDFFDYVDAERLRLGQEI